MNAVLAPYLLGWERTGHLREDVPSFFALHGDKNTLDHTRKVAAQAEQVARRYGADPAQAVAAALLHDISNVIPVPRMLETAEALAIPVLEEERKYARILHQKLSKAMAEALFGIADREILNAIECHTTLRPNASLLDRVLFVSDKTSWEQPGEHPDLEEVRKLVSDGRLQEGILRYLDRIWAQRDRLRLVHPWLIAAREELRRELGLDR